VLPLKTVPDADEIMAIIETLASRPADRPARATIIGCGYIGLEVASELKERGMEVTCVDMVPQVLPTFDPDMAQWVERQLRAKGVEVILSDGVKGFVTAQEERRGKKVDVAREVELQSGRKLPTDLVILSIGVKPQTTLAKEAGLEIGASGGVKTNHLCQSVTDCDVYVTGAVRCGAG
jgi:NADPH-dependent 2,4-dienoyl-CoA reductase/sulfur reductase-like enzyme